MKSIALHLPSVALGGAFALTLAVALGAQQVTPVPPRASATPSVVPGTTPQIERPFARDLVFLKSRTPFTVPTGRYLVVVGIGRTSNSSTWVYLDVNGSRLQGFTVASDNLSFGLGSGIAIAAGSLVEINAPQVQDEAWLFGYLEDA